MIRKAQPKLNYDVVVIGGGPAGAALATFLARHGHECLILNNTEVPRYHIGESLILNTYGVLDRLGLLTQLRQSTFPKKYSVRFVPPSGEEGDPFYFSECLPAEQAQTWQVQRAEFDRVCLENARDAGAEIWMPARASRVLFDRDRAIGVLAHYDGEEREVSARVVVDASGRATIIGNQLGLKSEVPMLRKATAWSYYRGARRREGIDAGETTVFMIPDRGWFWYIPLPDDIVSVGVVASPDYLFDESDEFEPAFLREVERCVPLKSFIECGERVDKVRGIRRLAYINRRTVGDGWVMIGDAAGFLDPVYSSGLFLALASAELAAGCVHDALEIDDTGAERLGAFCRPLWDGVDVVWRLIHAFYNPAFSFRQFSDRFPEHRKALIQCLVGDVVGRDMNPLLNALAEMTPPPPRVK